MTTSNEPIIISEFWKPVTSISGNYWVSNLGRIKNFVSTKKGVIERLVHGSISPTTGYRQLYLARNGKKTGVTFHSLVAEAFIGPRPYKYVINHIDQDRTNNCVTNLEYVTQKENLQKAWASGKVKRKPVSDETRQAMSRASKDRPSKFRQLSKEQVENIRERWPNCTIKSMAKEFGLSERAIFNVVHYISYRKWPSTSSLQASAPVAR